MCACRLTVAVPYRDGSPYAMKFALMNSSSRLLSTALWLSCLCSVAAVQARAGCKVVDLMPAFWRSFAEGDAAAQLRTKVIDPHPELYNENYVSLPSGAKWDTSVASERTYVDAHRLDVIAAERYLSVHVPAFMAEFRRTFPDYKCDFTFFIAPSFGQMDGSAGFVNGQQLIIFAPDVIPRYHKLPELKVLIDHETFHIYHHQSTGVYGASAEAVPTTLEALWSEGLATFVSWRMNPGVSLDIALLQPGIPEGANPHLADIAKDLLAHLDDRDATTYQHYFVGGRQQPGYPPRAGYFVGTLIAQNLSARYTLPQLAHLNGAELHTMVVDALGKLSIAQ
jgi:hypothetical protein